MKIDFEGIIQGSIFAVGLRKGYEAKQGELAQLVERLHGMQEVSGSTPLFSTVKGLFALFFIPIF
jgi:hypothetical protein